MKEIVINKQTLICGDLLYSDLTITNCFFNSCWNKRTEFYVAKTILECLSEKQLFIADSILVGEYMNKKPSLYQFLSLAP